MESLLSLDQSLYNWRKRNSKKIALTAGAIGAAALGAHKGTSPTEAQAATCVGRAVITNIEVEKLGTPQEKVLGPLSGSRVVVKVTGTNQELNLTTDSRGIAKLPNQPIDQDVIAVSAPATDIIDRITRQQYRGFPIEVSRPVDGTKAVLSLPCEIQNAGSQRPRPITVKTEKDRKPLTPALISSPTITPTPSSTPFATGTPNHSATALAFEKSSTAFSDRATAAAREATLIAKDATFQSLAATSEARQIFGSETAAARQEATSHAAGIKEEATAKAKDTATARIDQTATAEARATATAIALVRQPEEMGASIANGVGGFFRGLGFGGMANRIGALGGSLVESVVNGAEWGLTVLGPLIRILITAASAIALWVGANTITRGRLNTIIRWLWARRPFQPQQNQ